MTTLLAVDWGQGVENAWADVATFVPKFLVFAAILIVGFFVAKAVAKAISKVLDKVGFNKAVERGGMRKALANSSFEPSDILAKLVQYAAMLFVLQLAFSVFGPNPISALITSVIAYLPKIFVAIVIAVLAMAIAAAVREVVTAAIGGLSYGKAVANAAGVVIIAIGAFAALNQIEIAPEIVNGLFYAALAVTVGVTVVAVGGAGIKPMQSVWEQAIQKMQAENGNVAFETAGAKDRIKERAVDVRDSAQPTQQSEQPGSVSASNYSGNRNPQGF